MSRLNTAALSQPVYTMVQIILVDLLCAADINFAAVFGHSSSEIAAASFPPRKLPPEDAEELCALPDFKGRICVVACNSPTSVTLSGDADAIEEAKVIFNNKRKFARALRVDLLYGCCLVRNQNGIESFAEALGLVWKNTPEGVVASEHFHKAVHAQQ
ncbi:hypothetical protein W97_08404 [Coniosporium apollinis CBS 100218]|uniref:Malonyl-CoA:ACP transacylase (MAT) domain-containing protein n=1 Tax=Coniosporium apollinis (strain CBS 100218) TaxID=1168221 RepID=R7Z5B9_CONA1|nr:uncharacterized protein W97_08404 [Coniosporium apollinis CBS 100218]EON69091.1 hypothetical protein W97_08404 [Coniosporium apollinis CBS 100218]